MRTARQEGDPAGLTWTLASRWTASTFPELRLKVLAEPGVAEPVVCEVGVELSPQLRPGDVRRLMQVAEAIREPGVDIEPERAVLQPLQHPHVDWHWPGGDLLVERFGKADRGRQELALLRVLLLGAPPAPVTVDHTESGGVSGPKLGAVEDTKNTGQQETPQLVAESSDTAFSAAS